MRLPVRRWVGGPLRKLDASGRWPVVVVAALLISCCSSAAFGFGPVGTVFAANGNTSGGAPPDPSAAAGPESLIGVVNTNMRIFDKFGGTIATIEFDRFFEELQTGSVSFNFIFDPKIVYDQYLKKFIVIIIAAELGANGFEDSYVLVGISTTPNPPGDPPPAPNGQRAWLKYAIQTSTNTHWSDYPGLGVDEDTIYLTYNMFPKTGGGAVFVRQHLISKTGLDNPTNPPPALNSGFFDNIRQADGNLAFTLQPAHSFGTTQTQWFASIPLGFGSSDQIYLYERDGGSSPNVSRISAVRVPNFTTTGFVGRQRGTSAQLDTLGDRMMNAVWRDNSLWCTHTVLGPTGTMIRWYEFDTSQFPNAPVLVQTGDIAAGPGGIGGQVDNFVPSIMVNAAGDMLVAFTSAGPSQFPSLVYSHRERADAAGTTRTPTLVVAGPNEYTGFGFGSERWGDYCGNALDPADESTFWMFHELAVAGIPRDWTTWFGSATLTLGTTGPPGPPAPPAPTSIILERPNQFVNFVTETTERISWSIFGRGDAPVDIVLFRNQIELGKIATNLPADTANFDWTVGALLNGAAIIPGEAYQVRIQAVNDPTIFDQSTAFFRITEKVIVDAGVFDTTGALQQQFEFGPGESVQLDAIASLGMAPYFYRWAPQDFLDNPNTARPRAVPLRTVMYTVTVRDGTGNSTSSQVELVAGNPLRIDAGETRLFPSGGTVVLEGFVQGGTPPYSIDWFDCDPGVCTAAPIANTIQPIVSPAGLTAYFLRVTDGAGDVRTDNMLAEPGFNILFENEPGNGGTITRSPVKSLYRATDIVEYTAIPATGFAFDHWENGATGTDNPVTVSFQGQDITVRAIYVLDLGPGTGPLPPGVPLCGNSVLGFGVTALALLAVHLGARRFRRRRRR